MTPTEKIHARFSASSSERWLQCPGSIELSKKAPPPPDSKYSREGTCAHECLEFFLTQSDRTKWFPLKGDGDKYPPVMVEYAKVAANQIRAMVPEGAELFAETKSSLAHIDPEAFGTSDAVIVDLFGKLIVVDFKYGAGVAVDAEENAQLAFYALGIAHKYDYEFSSVEIVIIQPRAYHPKGPVRSWTLTIAELQTWSKRFEDGIKRCKDPLAPLVAGDHCRFCPAKTVCPEISDRAFSQARIDFAPMADSALGLVSAPEVVEIKNLAIPELGEILSALPKLETWIDAIRERAHAALTRGERIPGWKLVDKRGTRQWDDIARARRILMQLCGNKVLTEPELLSPAQIEKKLPNTKPIVEQLVVTVSSGTSLAPEKDKRPAIDQITRDFANVEPKNKSVPTKKSEADWRKDNRQKAKTRTGRQHRAGMVAKRKIKKRK